MMRGILAILSITALSGCLFSSVISAYYFKVELSGFFLPVYSYHTNGSVAQPMGVGLEQRRAASDGLLLAPVDEEYGVGSYFLRITRDSTFVSQIVEMATPLPVTKVRAKHKGAPCTFSGPRSFQVGGGDSAAAIPLVVSGTYLTVNADTVRLALTIDTIASRLADPRVDFSRPLLTATLNVSCPEP